MAEHAQDRTERPTPKRLEEARRKGQVPRSVELNAAAVVLVAGLALYVLGPHLGGGMYEVMRSGLSLSREQAMDETFAVVTLGSLGLAAALTIVPILALTLVGALTAPMIIGGWNVSPGVLAPDFTRLSPLNGFKRMFSARGLVELGKAFAKFLLVALIACIFLRTRAGELLSLGSEPVTVAIGHAARLCGLALVILSGALGLVAAVDVPWQLWQHHQKLRMTRQEVRDELKESEGSPEVKGRIRSLQQELSRRRMMQEVPKADVVVVNPTHYAVALRYDERRMRAPVVVAKGADEVAARIREIAVEHSVPLFEAPPLARALFRVDLGAEVPASLYAAVAQVLTYVYQLRAARSAGAPLPQPPVIDDPAEPTRH